MGFGMAIVLKKLGLIDKDESQVVIENSHVQRKLTKRRRSIVRKV